MVSENNPFGSSSQKYWDKRHTFFSKWEDGVQTDAEGLFSVKPEEAALAIAKKVPGEVILDAFCGIGGSAIAFARAGKRVIAVDTNAKRLSMAKHNADLYGVTSHIDFLFGNVFSLYDPLYDTLKFSAVHVDPPWGGPDYAKKTQFGLSDFAPDPKLLLDKSVERGVFVALALPSNFSLIELASYTPFEVEDIQEGDQVTFKMAYLG